jgi:hypothetical protein
LRKINPKGKSNMRLALAITIVITSFMVVLLVPHNHKNVESMTLDQKQEAALRKTDNFLRQNVVLLVGPKGSCTGFQVSGPSGTIYTLTAAHCRILLRGNEILAVNENGTVSILHYIEESPIADLMLLTSLQKTSIHLADEWSSHEHAHSMTHGAGMPSYRTDGELLKLDRVEIAVNSVYTDEDKKNCERLPKYEVVDDFCVMGAYEVITTVPVVGGSSGGPVVNDNGDLVGVAVAGEEKLSALVTLEDIRYFLIGR